MAITHRQTHTHTRVLMGGIGSGRLKKENKYCICGVEKTSLNTSLNRHKTGLANLCKICSTKQWAKRKVKYIKKTAICKGCGIEFSKPGSFLYCPKCRKISSWERRKEKIKQAPKGIKYRICKYCGNEFEVTKNHKFYCSKECTYTSLMERNRKANIPFSCIIPGCDGRVTKEGIPCQECRKRIKSQKVIFLDLAKNWFKPVKKEFKSAATKFCRNCGKPIQNRGNYTDWCMNCLPVKSIPIGFCRYCGKVFIRKGRQKHCNDCQPKDNAIRAKKGKSLAKAYKNNLKKSGCVVCGYNKCLTALEFHHIDEKKDITFSRKHSIAEMRLEIERNEIVILCANCHREVHSGLIDDNDLKLNKLTIRLKQESFF